MEKIKVKDEVHEKCVRKTFSKIGDFIEIPNLLKVQKDSFDKEKTNTVLKKLFGNMPKLKKESKEYELGMKYIDNKANYVQPTVNDSKYREQIIEKEAFSVSDMSDEIYNYFSDIWRLF